jgi:hypothetical protein
VAHQLRAHGSVDFDGRRIVFDAPAVSDDFWSVIMSIVLKLIAIAAWSSYNSTFPVLLIFTLVGLLASLFAALNGIMIVEF